MKSLRFKRPRPKTDKPRDSRAWKILNSSIVIWALTAILGSVLTFTFTNLQSCLKDADEKATRGNKVFREILDRRVTIAEEDARSHAVRH